MRFPILLVGLTLSGAVLAHPGGHGDGHAPSRPAPSTAPAPTEIPAHYAEVVDALKTRAAAASTALDGQKIVDVHRAVRAMTDLAAALPAKAEGFSAESKTTVAARATSIKQQLDALVIAADKGNTSNGKAALTAIQADIDALAALK